MTADNADFMKQVEEARQRMAKLDELRVAVIKGHLLVEEAMDGFLNSALFNPDYLMDERPTFHFKGKMALALSLKEDKDRLWAVLWAINQLRNKIAHQIDSKEIEEKKQYLRKKFLEALEPRPRGDAEKMTEVEFVTEACYLVAGLFGQLTLDAKGRRGIIDKHWKARSES